MLHNDGYDILGLDWSPYNNVSYVQKKDITQQFDLGRKYDYVQSFEVGQHVRPEYQDGYIANLANSASKGIIISWAIIGQGGSDHINTQNSDTLIPKFEKHGLKFNEKDTKHFRDINDGYFKTNLMVFDKL